MVWLVAIKNTSLSEWACGKRPVQKKEEVVLLWDGCIHFMEISPQCALVSAVGGVGVYSVGEVGTYGAGSGVFRRSGGELLSGCQERSQRSTGGSHRSNFGPSASFSMLSPPWTPVYGGRQLGSSCGFRKGAGGVGIDVASPTAAAAWVGFPA